MVKSSNCVYDLNKLYGPEDLGSNPGLEKFLHAKRFQAHIFQWGSISARWLYWSRMIACCLLHKPKKYFDKQNESFFIRDKYSHLAICLRLMEPHCSLGPYGRKSGAIFNTKMCLWPKQIEDKKYHFCWALPRFWDLYRAEVGKDLWLRRRNQKFSSIPDPFLLN